MRVRGDLQPSNAFTIEEQPKRPGFVRVRFFENAAPFEETRDGLTISGWEYDEYHLEMANIGNLQDDIINNFDALLAQAKIEDAGNQPADIETRVADLEQNTASKDDVQAVWDQMAAAYNEGVQEA